MTDEEQQACFAKQEQDRLDKCRIKSEERNTGDGSVCCRLYRVVLFGNTQNRPLCSTVRISKELCKSLTERLAKN